MWNRIIIFLLISIFMATQAKANATIKLKKTVDDVVRIVSNKELKKDDTKRRQALKQAVSVIFDYTEMAKRSLGRD